MRILYNATIHTLDPQKPQVEALAEDNGKIIATGSTADMLALASRADLKINLRNKTILPGLTDAHHHLMYFSTGLEFIDCETATRAETLARVAEKASHTLPGGWIRGHGWNQNVWEDGYGTASELDAAALLQPVYLTAKSLHASWANTLALRLAGINADTPDPEGGMIGRNADGQPNGLLFESAMNLVEKIIPQPSGAELEQSVLHAQNVLWQMGITGVHDFDGPPLFRALQNIEASGKLQLRVVKNIPLEYLSQAVALGLQSGFGSDRLRIGSVKLFADGALGPHTAAMFQPYEGTQNDVGVLLLDSESAFEYGIQAVNAGISIAVHAIGDRANHEILNAYAHIRDHEKYAGLPQRRHRIEHVQVLHPQDIARLAELDIIASVQPIHATSDMFIADQHWGSRSSKAYAFRSLLNHGTHLAFGSDAPVESPNPFLGIHAAVTRRRPNGLPGVDGWYPEQRLTLLEALGGYTTGAAYAAGWEKSLGKLAPGYHADLIVLEKDPFQIDTQEICQLEPCGTLFAGEWVWQKEDLV